MFVLNAKLCNVLALKSEVFGEVNLIFFIWGLLNFLPKKSGLIFKSPVATLPPTPQLTYTPCGLYAYRAMPLLYPSQSAIV